METRFLYRVNLEYERLFVIFSDIARRLYQNNGFLVLPYPLRNHPKSIFLPRIKNFDPKKYMSEFKDCLLANIPLNKDEGIQKFLDKVKESGFEPESINKNHFKRVEEKWRLIQEQFEDYFVEIFPQYRRYRIIVEIYGTKYGSLVSFSGVQLKSKKALVKIFLRDDMGVAQIIEGFVSSFFRDKMAKGSNYSFIQREAIVDFIIQNTKLSRLSTGYFPTLNSVAKDKSLHKYYKESLRYLRELGFSVDSGLTIYKGDILINGELPKYSFSESERLLLKRLIMSPNEPVSYYEIGDILWKNDADKFSLWAITRLVFKTRNKLYKNGLSPEHVKNLRGRGYYFTPQP